MVLGAAFVVFLLAMGGLMVLGAAFVVYLLAMGGLVVLGAAFVVFLLAMGRLVGVVCRVCCISISHGAAWWCWVPRLLFY